MSWPKSSGTVASPLPVTNTNAGAIVYGYDTQGRLSTETRTLQGVTQVRTWTYNTDGSLAGFTDWS